MSAMNNANPAPAATPAPVSAATATPAPVSAPTANAALAPTTTANVNAGVRFPVAPAVARLPGRAYSLNDQEYFVCHAQNDTYNRTCLTTVRNKPGSINSHATRVHNQRSKYQEDQDKSKIFRCSKCKHLTEGFNPYIKHWRDYHEKAYKKTGGKPLRFHELKGPAKTNAKKELRDART
ncbi:hypothetical protein F5X99DRAFT_412404 [Biscogniauxia marginata]|nr:hypothetical protein F5X99DRAFT_412404 [Biscogniauxia marginata]